MDSLPTFETKQELDIIEKQNPLLNILEKQAKGFEEFGRRMNLELQSTLLKQQQNGSDLPKSHRNTCSECREKTVLINSLKARIEELEDNSRIKSQEIKKLQGDVQALFDIISKKDTKSTKNVEKSEVITKIKITNEIGEELDDVEDTKQVNIEVKHGIENHRLNVESFQYNDDFKDSYSDSAIDLFTDDDDDSDTTTTEDSTKEDNLLDTKYVNKYDRPSEWLDVSQTLKKQRISRVKIDKKNLDRWNYKMATNGLLPIKLVGKVEADEEKKIQTHRKRYSTSAIWLKTYEHNQNNQKQQNHDDKFKIPSFNFSRYRHSISSMDDIKPKQKETYSPISLKSSASTSVSELSTTSLATTSLQPYELLEHQKNTPVSKESYSKSQQILFQYK